MSYSKFLNPHNCRQKAEIRGKKKPSACFVLCDAPLWNGYSRRLSRVFDLELN